MPCILKNKKHNKITNKASLVLIAVSCWFIVYFSMHEIGLLVNRAKKIFKKKCSHNQWGEIIYEETSTLITTLLHGYAPLFLNCRHFTPTCKTLWDWLFSFRREGSFTELFFIYFRSNVRDFNAS